MHSEGWLVPGSVLTGANPLAIVILTAGADMVTEKLACRANQPAAGPAKLIEAVTALALLALGMASCAWAGASA